MSVMIIFGIIVFVIAMYITYTPVECENFGCFSTRMVECDTATYINEESEASWEYRVMGKTDNSECAVEVTLLQAKEGDLAIKIFEGHRMTCFYPLGKHAYPEKDLLLCHGRLKEDLQSVIINKLHEYILDNLIEANLQI